MKVRFVLRGFQSIVLVNVGADSTLQPCPNFGDHFWNRKEQQETALFTLVFTQSDCQPS